ncbi:hypothetical protein [Novisyntrophococcus fermenticellae]|uniref:hypothetical protein n=1 Tax=Novisyntrophococcus fermenticellae TaxID=2068655 RepID=UPI001E63A4E5|nr:hypothetical protein [Novisyntrophococcus fermenticellae]
MMISPETYYDMELKGKFKEEIMIAIQELKEEINEMKNVVESTEMHSEQLVHPSPKVRIKCDLDYLERAKAALSEIGEIYVPSEEEKKSDKFNNHMDSLWKITLCRDGYLIGRITYCVTVENASAIMCIKHFPNLKNNARRTYGMDKDFLLESIRGLHIGTWDTEYNDYDVLDGEGWELVLEFADGFEKQEFSGINAYPWNYEDLWDALQIEDENEE